MNNKKSTKRALISSVLSLVLCMSMLIGTTFAWFTDTASSKNNKIVAGNLDVDLLMHDGNEYIDISENSSPIFGSGSIAQDNNEQTLWEPGKTQVAYLKIANNGNLALRYTVALDVENVSNDLYEVMKYAIISDAQPDSAPVQSWDASKGSSVVVGTQAVSEGVSLGAGESHYFALAIHMAEEAGNEYQGGEVNFDLNVMATQDTVEDDSFNNLYDKDAKLVATPAEAQAALDNAAPGTTIQLAAGVNYGTLYMRPSSNEGVTKEVDWVGNNYRYETYSLFKNVTIVGAKGATVDAIAIEGGTYFNTQHSQAETYPIMLSLIELDGVVIDGVTFTGKGGYDPQGHGNAINLSGNNIKVDGLTLKNCVLDNKDNNARLIYKTESTTTVHKYVDGEETKTFVPSLKDITVTGCELNGGYIGLELRETENVTITNNTFNVADRNILLPVNAGCAYSETITITGNVSNFAKERFVRADGMGTATVIIKDNILNGYMGADEDFIKVTNHTGESTITNNVLTTGVDSIESLQNALNNAADGDVICLAKDLKGTVIVNQPDGSDHNVTIDGFGHKYDGTIKLQGNSQFNGEDDDSIVIKNINFETETKDTDFIWSADTSAGSVWRYAHNVTIKDCTFTAKGEAVYTTVGARIHQAYNINVVNCKAVNMHSLIQAESCASTVTVDKCETVSCKNGVSFNNTKNAIVKNTKIESVADGGYGIRHKGQEPSYALTVENCEVKAFVPVLVRNMTGTGYIATFGGANTLTATNDFGYQLVLSANDWDNDAAQPNAPTGTFTLVGADNFKTNK